MYKYTSAVDSEKREWCFINSKQKTNESVASSLIRTIKEEADIKVEGVEQLTDNFYHAKLTDDNVNQIKRQENQLLDFFTLRDLHKLRLEEKTKVFAYKYGNLI
jgi:hypothetical protein